MKRITLLLILMLVSVIESYGQASGYIFSASTGAYTETSGSATLLPLVRADTYISPAQNIGFNFNYEGVAYTQFKMSSNGFITFNTAGASLTTNDFATANATSRPIIAPLWDDLDGATPASSVAAYEITGTSPNQVLTVEWRNWEWNFTSTTPVISFQVKLYETTNVIEFVYRQEATAVTSGSASIGIGSATGSGVGSFLNVTDITTSQVSNVTSVINLNTKPATGQIYTWTPQTCFAPSSLTVSNITTTDATISWIAPSTIPASGYEYYYSTSNIAPVGVGTATNNLTENLTGLSSNTNYFVWIRSNCGAGDYSSWAGPVTFATACTAFTVPSLENFTSYVPNCWQEADNGDVAAGPLTFGASAWVVDGFGNVGTTGAAKYNISTNLANDWLLTPVYAIPAIGHELKFDAAATQAGNANLPTTAWESDDIVEVLVSTGTTNWTVLYTYNDLNVPSNTGTTNYIDLDAYAGQNVRFAFRVVEGSNNGAASIDFSIDNFEVRLTPSCVEPLDLMTSNVTSSSADLSWTESGTATLWNIQYGVTGFVLGSGTIVNGVTNPYTLSGLLPTTTYQFYVQADCGAGDTSSWTGPVSFTTPCAAYTVPSLEDFTTYVPNCWQEADNGDIAAGPLTFGASTWIVDGFGNVGTTGAARYNISTNVANDWLLTPVYAIPAIGHELKFDAAATQTGSVNLPTTAWESDDFVEVLVSTGTTNWTVLYTYNDLNVPSNTGTTNYIDLDAYAGQNVRFAFRVVEGADNGAASIDFSIDNFEVRLTPSCIEPLDLMFSNVTSTSADLSWTENGTATLWNIQYGVTGFVLGSGTIVNGVTNPYTLSGLLPTTTYQFYVQADCGAGDTSSWTGPISFTTLCAIYTVPSLEDFTTYVPNCWQEADNGDVTGGPLTFGTSTWIVDGFGNVGTTGAARYNISTNVANDWLLTPVYAIPAIGYEIKFDAAATQAGSANLLTTAWESDDIVEVLVSTGTTNWTVLYTYNDLNVPSNTGTTNYIDLDAYAGQNVRFAFRVVEGSDNGAASIDFSIDNFEVRLTPTCIEPLDLMSSNVTSSSANLSWTENGTATLWNIQYGVTGFVLGSGTIVNGVTNPYTLSGLLPTTTYQFYVQADCGAGDTSSWTGPFNFKTLCDSVTLFTENFDTSPTGTGNLPNCWNSIGTATTVYNTTGSVAPMSPSNKLYLNAGTGLNAVAALPTVSNLSQGTHRLVLTAYATAAGKTLEVGYLTDGSDANSFVLIQSIPMPSTVVASAQVFTIIPTAIPAGVMRLALRNQPATGTSTIYIDDVKWEAIPSCVEPTNIAVNGVTTTSANLTWTASFTPPAEGYEYYYSTVNTAPTAGTVPTGAVGAGVTSVNLTGLTSSTMYYVWVRSKCAASDISSWSVLFSFATNCAITTVPYMQDFESSIVPNMPICTSIENAGTGNNWITATNPGFGFTSKVLRYSYNSTNAANAWFYTQAITLTAGTSYDITYKYGNNSTTYIEKLKVAYGMTSTSAGMTTVLADHPNITGGTATSTAIQNMVSFTPTVSGEYYFGFNAYSIADQFYIYVDDITITTTLGTNSFDNANFSYYPNPVKNKLNLSYTQNISEVAVYNLLGQQVIAKTINANQSQIDMSHLSGGTYIVKVTADNQVKTIKVIKE